MIFDCWPFWRAIRMGESATTAAILAGWPGATGIVYRRILDDLRDFAAWQSGGTYYMVVTGLEIIGDFIRTGAYAATFVDVGFGIRTSSYLWRTSQEARRFFRDVSEGDPLVLAGHSAGGVTVALFGALRVAYGAADKTTVVTFGMPLPFNALGRDYLGRCDATHYAIPGDLVTYIPLAGDNVAGRAARWACLG